MATTKKSSTKAKTSTSKPRSTPARTRAPKKPKPTTVPVLPLRGMVAFPSMVLPLFVGREKSIAALHAAGEGDRTLLLAAQRDETIEEPGTDDLYTFGTLAEVMQLLKMPDGNVRVVVEGRERVRVLEYSDDGSAIHATIETVADEAVPETPETEALTRRLRSDFEQVVNLSRRIPPELLQSAQTTDTLGPLADLVISYLEVSVEDRQKALEMSSPTERANFLTEVMSRELQILEIDKEIDVQVREGMNESQREYFLRERMKAIQDKLGDRDSTFREADQLRERVEAAEMTDEAKERALTEIDRMEKMPSIAPEVSVIRTYVEMLCDLPWSKRTDDNLDITRAQEVLDEDHYALEKIKDRILEFLAVRKLNPNSRGPILCFMGPPGVGKTSIGKSIAKAMGREFIRVSVGGIHDEAEIRGHRRTYIGSMPGRIITAMKRAGVRNPVFMLDEIDKLGNDFRGDPASALLEALDPEQNSAFSDHYLEIPFDLSDVMFIATGNLLDPIPSALRDRLEVLRFAGYTETEKAAIAHRFLIPKQMKENGITEEHINFTEDGVIALIRQYTRESGVRNLEREVGTVCRKVAREVAAEKWTTKIEVTPQSLREYLGPRKHTYGTAQEVDEVGVAQGLAWTEVGGELMPIEVSLVAGKGGTKLTGNLGNVMKESAEAAMTYARSHAEVHGISGDWTKKHDAHVHVPSGAVPKDGPSAGVAIAVALISAMTGRPVRKELAMTGEISLRGRVMSIGGVKEKVLAAHREGITEIMLPKENERDFDDIPTEVRQALTFHWVNQLDEAVQLALVTEKTGKTEKKQIASSKAAVTPRRSTPVAGVAIQP